MPIETTTEMLDIAELPLADGRKLALPLLALAEVKQIRPSDEGLGSIRWRGHELDIHSLEAYLGLKRPPLEAHTTVGIFRAAKGSEKPFHALAFCGLAAHRCVQARDMEPVDVPEEGLFSAAAKIDGDTYLVPDLPQLMFQSHARGLH